MGNSPARVYPGASRSAQKKGMVSLKEAGEALIRAGVTTAQEVTRVIEAVDEEVT